MANINALKIHDGDIGVASSHLTGNAEAIGRAFGLTSADKGSTNGTADFVSVKTTNGYATRGPGADCADHCKEQEDRRIALLRDEQGVVGALNSETSYGYSFAQYLNMLEESLKMGKPLMISVGYEVDEIIRTITGIREITNNYPNCPIAFELSLHHAKDKSVVKDRIEAAVKASGDYPLFVKISYYGGDYLEIARMAVEECGARGIIGINSLGPYEDINGVLAPGDPGWLSGDLIANVSMEICRQVVADVCNQNGVPYIAVGGVNRKNLISYFQSGANAVAACTYLMTFGVSRGLDNFKKALRLALQTENVPSVSKLRGTRAKNADLDRFTFDGELAHIREIVTSVSKRQKRTDSLMRPLQINVDADRCNGCGICVDGCAEGAIALESRVAQVNTEICEKCGACLGACKRGAISFRTI